MRSSCGRCSIPRKNGVWERPRCSLLVDRHHSWLPTCHPPRKHTVCSADCHNMLLVAPATCPACSCLLLACSRPLCAHSTTCTRKGLTTRHPCMLPCPPPLYCAVLHCEVPYCNILYCTVLYCTVSKCTVLCYLPVQTWMTWSGWISSAGHQGGCRMTASLTTGATHHQHDSTAQPTTPTNTMATSSDHKVL